MRTGSKMTTELRKKQTTFVDISLTFTPNPLTGDLTVLRDDRAIISAVKNLILIKPNEVPFQRNIGSTISELLFEFCDEFTASKIEEEVRRTITYNEPRVEIQKLIVQSEPERNEFLVHVEFNIVGYERVYTIDEILTSTR